jgi:hypothetical protein
MRIANTNLRIFAAVIMITSIVWGYWWMVLALAIIFLFIFPSYYEIIFWGVTYDSLYGISMTYTLGSLILFIIAYYLKQYLFAYN